MFYKHLWKIIKNKTESTAYVLAIYFGLMNTNLIYLPGLNFPYLGILTDLTLSSKQLYFLHASTRWRRRTIKNCSRKSFFVFLFELQLIYFYLWRTLLNQNRNILDDIISSGYKIASTDFSWSLLLKPSLVAFFWSQLYFS